MTEWLAFTVEDPTAGGRGCAVIVETDRWWDARTVAMAHLDVGPEKLDVVDLATATADASGVHVETPRFGRKGMRPGQLKKVNRIRATWVGNDAGRVPTRRLELSWVDGGKR